MMYVPSYDGISIGVWNMANAPKTPTVDTNEVIETVKTRLNKDATDKVETKLTITFDDDKVEREYATRGIIITMQSIWRNAGVIPDTDVVSLSELGKRVKGGGFKSTPESLSARIGKQTRDEYTSTLTLLGIDAKTINAMVTKKFGKQ
jgi:hypothetical protein